MAVVLRDFVTISPDLTIGQEDTLAWIASGHVAARRAQGQDIPPGEVQQVLKRLKRYGGASNHIAFRRLSIPDFQHANFDDMLIYRVTDDPRGSPINARTNFYKEVTTKKFRDLYLGNIEAPDHIVHVTCTGYVSPSPAQVFVSESEWQGRAEVTHAYHMGCYAALPAIRLADGLAHRISQVDDRLGRVDIVHSEICSLHLNLLADSPEQMVVQGLFADGFVRYSAVPVERDYGPSPHLKFLLLGVCEQIVPDTADQMTWMSHSWGMQMTLAREIPETIRVALPSFIERLARFSGMAPAQLIDRAVWAIHPGGPRIIDHVAACLGLREEQVQASRKVLHERGNMSSATIPHVWNELARSLSGGEIVVSLAFGPGLSIFGSIMRTMS